MGLSNDMGGFYHVDRIENVSDQISERPMRQGARGWRNENVGDPRHTPAKPLLSLRIRSWRTTGVDENAFNEHAITTGYSGKVTV